MSQLEGRVAVITGGNSGIGLATAKLFVAEGARVAIFGRNQETLDAAVESLGADAVGVRGDVSNPEDIDRLYGVVAERFGKIDILFVNAGIAQFLPFAEVTEEFFDRTFEINVKGAFFTVQKALPLLQDGASVILTSSVVNQMGMADSSVYAASKAALRNLARTVSAELVERRIRVNVVSPGPIETPIFERLGLPQEAMEKMGGQIVSQVPVGRMGNADEIAGAVLFLASSASTYVLGAELVVDGGMTQI